MAGNRDVHGAVAALNADVVGYSRLMADDLEATSAAMTAARSVVERGVDARGGRLVNFVGDNFMAVFDSTREGVKAAIEITTALEASNAALPSSRWLRFRMGMDRGTVKVSSGHFEGEVLNVAARIQALARPGGLSVSGRVYRALDEPALRFRPKGTQRLKNVPEPVAVYEFVDLPSSDRGPIGASSLSLEIPTVAVLPIHTEGVDARVRSAAGVIRADILHRLAAIPELVVVDAVDVEDGLMGQAARYMLETGVHQFGADLRVYATLFDGTTMNVVKSHKASATVDEVLGLSERLAEDVGNAIEVELVVGAPAGLYAELNDAAAIAKVYRGWYQLRSDTREGWQRAVELFGDVADSHPDQPYGWVLSGFANWIGAANSWTSDAEETLAIARKQAHTGMSIGDPTGMAQAVDAAVLMSMGRIEEAVDAIEDLEISRPTCDVTFGLEGSLKRYLGEWEQAVDLLDRAMRLTGINKPWYPTVKACSLFIGNRVEQAASVAESVLEYQPNNLEALLVLAAAQVELGMERRAKATAQRIRDNFPAIDAGGWLDRSPYQDAAIIERWKADLVSADLITAG